MLPTQISVRLHFKSIVLSMRTYVFALHPEGNMKTLKVCYFNNLGKHTLCGSLSRRCDVCAVARKCRSGGAVRTVTCSCCTVQRSSVPRLVAWRIHVSNIVDVNLRISRAFFSSDTNLLT